MYHITVKFLKLSHQFKGIGGWRFADARFQEKKNHDRMMQLNRMPQTCGVTENMQNTSIVMKISYDQIFQVMM